MILLWQGYRDDAVRTLRYMLLFAALALATNALTKTDSSTPREGSRLWAQILLCMGAIVATGLVSAWFGSEDDPAYDALSRFYSSGCWQFAAEVIAVFLGLRFLGLKADDLGLRRWAPKALLVGLLWVATAIAFLTSDVLSGVISSGEAFHQVCQNVFRNGFSEEFLFRGALLSRLRVIVPDEWAILGQALIFGLWHYGADVRAAQGNIVVTLCFAVTVQGVFGYALGFLALRTRSLAIGSVFHAIADATDII
jgi:membrane protease YdiL (CAAX protease family)